MTDIPRPAPGDTDWVDWADDEEAMSDAVRTGIVTTTSQAGTSYTLALADAGTVVETTSATAVALTVPPNSSVAFAVGTTIVIRQYGAGQVTITPGSGVTLRSAGSAYKTALQYAEAAITKRATNEWVVSGYVVA